MMVMFQLMLLVMPQFSQVIKFYNFFLLKDLAFIGYCVTVTAVSVCLYLCMLNVAIYAEVHTLMHTHGHHLE